MTINDYLMKSFEMEKNKFFSEINLNSLEQKIVSLFQKLD